MNYTEERAFAHPHTTKTDQESMSQENAFTMTTAQQTNERKKRNVAEAKKKRKWKNDTTTLRHKDNVMQ